MRLDLVDDLLGVVCHHVHHELLRRLDVLDLGGEPLRARPGDEPLGGVRGVAHRRRAEVLLERGAIPRPNEQGFYHDH